MTPLVAQETTYLKCPLRGCEWTSTETTMVGWPGHDGLTEEWAQHWVTHRPRPFRCFGQVLVPASAGAEEGAL